MLYHLNQLRAVVAEMPMRAFYQDEPSSLRPLRIIGPFLVAHAANFARRLVYGYFLRGFSVASLELLISIPLLAFGTVFGIHAWWQSFSLAEPATAGTVMLAALPLILGSQLFSWLIST